MSGRQELTDQLDQAYREFRATVEDLNEDQFQQQWLDGRWGTRGITAHIAGWCTQLGTGLERMSRGERPTPEGVDWTDVDGWNQRFSEEAAGKGKAQVLAELDQSVARFKEAASRLPDDRFGEGKTTNRMFDLAGIGHFREHTEMIRSWRGA